MPCKSARRSIATMLAPIVAAGMKPGAILDARELHHVVRGLETAVGEDQPITVPGALQTWPATTHGLAPGEPAFVVGRRAPGHTIDALDVRIGALHRTRRAGHAQRSSMSIARSRWRACGGARRTSSARPAMPSGRRCRQELEKLGVENNLVTAATSLIVLESDAEESATVRVRARPPPTAQAPSARGIDQRYRRRG